MSNISEIKTYYQASENAYLNWGRDEVREGIYALHCGLSVEGCERSHYDEVKELTRQLIGFAKIPLHSTVLDAGCGAGAVAFELGDLHPDARIVGINISQNQLASAVNFGRDRSAGRVFFSEQDYLHQAFADQTFDVVVFCESYIHTIDRSGLANEVFRILKPGGKIVLSDTFAERAPISDQESIWLDDLLRGWCLPNIVSIAEFESTLKNNGFTEISNVDHTLEIKPSLKRMSQHAQLRVEEGNLGSAVIQLSRKSAIACDLAAEHGLTSYRFVSGQKPC